MDRYLTTGQVARRLGTTIPRVHRAARNGVVPCQRSPNGRLLFRPDAVRALRRLWGSCAPVDGLDREEIFVLAALSRRPLGLRSARAVARAAGCSPTTAKHALDALAQGGYVRHRIVRVAEGRARDADVWEVRWGSRAWMRVATDVGRCELPQRRDAPRPRVPRRLAHLFWNVDVDDLDPVRHGRYIADRILRDGDAQGLAWLATALPRRAIRDAASGRGLDPRRAALARVLAS